MLEYFKIIINSLLHKYVFYYFDKLLADGIQHNLLKSTLFSSIINFVSKFFVDLLSVHPLHSFEQETNMRQNYINNKIGGKPKV